MVQRNKFTYYQNNLSENILQILVQDKEILQNTKIAYWIQYW